MAKLSLSTAARLPKLRIAALEFVVLTIGDEVLDLLESPDRFQKKTARLVIAAVNFALCCEISHTRSSALKIRCAEPTKTLR